MILNEKSQLQEPEPIEFPSSLQDLQQELLKYTQILKDIHNSYECPKCNTVLKMKDNRLLENPSYIAKSECNLKINEINAQINLQKKYQNELDLYHKKLEYIQHKLQKYNGINTNIDELQSKLLKLKSQLEVYTIENTKLNQYYERLDSIIDKYEQMKSTLHELNRKYKSLKQSMKEYDNIQLPDGMDLSHAKNTLIELQTQNTMLKNTEFKYRSLLNKIENLQVSLSDIKLKHEQINVEKQNIHLHDLNELESLIDSQREQLSYLQLLKSQQSTKQLYEKYTQQQDEIAVEIVKCEKLLTASLQFKEKIAEAESIALSNLINTINTNVQLYLDAFFEKEPIQVSISCFKIVKDTKKPQITINTVYKGNQVELSNLSGGEYDRVVLAFALTFADITQSPLLLLDECVSSLDQENADLVFNCIKSQCRNKLVVLIAHQIVTGMFDKKMNL
jgi:DNA repair exonuclease SbcCD ATPase subunit